MLTPGDVVELGLGTPAGAEAGLHRPAVVVTAERILRGGPNVVQMVPLTRTIRDNGSKIVIEPDVHNGLNAASAAQCQHIRSVATIRVARGSATWAWPCFDRSGAPWRSSSTLEPQGLLGDGGAEVRGDVGDAGSLAGMAPAPVRVVGCTRQGGYAGARPLGVP